MNNTSELFGSVIYSYSRKQAIEDGVLIDLNAICPEECKIYKFPVACTSAVWAIVDQAVKNKRHCNDLKGVVWDMLYMSTVMKRMVSPTTAHFQVIIKGAGRRSTFTFQIVCGPGDNAEPVMTIMLPEED